MPDQGEPTTSSDTPPSDEDPGRAKRSRAVSLVLMAGCGALAYQLAKLENLRRGEEVRVYRDLQACLDGHLRKAADCRSAAEAALDLYPRVMPEYDGFSACEIVHGASACRFDPRERQPGESKAVPAMAGFVVGLSAERDLPPQPVFGSGCNAPGLSRDRDDYLYVTASDALLETPAGAGSAVAYGDPAKLRAEPDALRKSVLGGFGKTGRTCVHRTSSGGG